jgi:hypothetical protein
VFLSLHQEHPVLSAHELATLMRVKDAADHIADREETVRC